MEIKLSEKDIKYFEMLNNSISECERNIVALVIEKERVINTFFAVEEKYREFSKQIRTKYEVQHPEAEIDLVKGIIFIPDDNADAGSSGTEVNTEPLKKKKVKKEKKEEEDDA